jgi:imidazolonepropionase
MTKIDLLIHSADQLITCASDGPKRGKAMKSLGVIEQCAIAIHQGNIVAVGSASELKAEYQAEKSIDASGHSVCPGFVDPHTHTVYGGDRAHEFEMRIESATYMEIMAAGGGIVSTMKHTREASVETLTESGSKRLDQMLALGTTTVEIKTGYGLDLDTELKMLQVIERLSQIHPCDIVPTFLGAHTVPPEFKDDTQGYVQYVINDMIPAVADWYASSSFKADNVPLFIDVFCEDHAFNVEQSKQVLEAGQNVGLIAKIHVDQFNSFDGVTMAVELGAISADHLDVTKQDEIELLAKSNTISIPLPAVNFNLALDRYADARAMVDAGAALALATDLNPGSAPCLSMPLTMAVACRYQRLTPAEAMNASTINAAYAIGLGHRVGSVEVGKQADILILDEPDYRHLSYMLGGNLVKTVIKRGQVIEVNV